MQLAPQFDRGPGVALEAAKQSGNALTGPGGHVIYSSAGSAT
jgi:hypothetical protein